MSVWMIVGGIVAIIALYIVGVIATSFLIGILTRKRIIDWSLGEKRTFVVLWPIAIPIVGFIRVAELICRKCRDFIDEITSGKTLTFIAPGITGDMKEDGSIAE